MEILLGPHLAVSKFIKTFFGGLFYVIIFAIFLSVSFEPDSLDGGKD